MQDNRVKRIMREGGLALCTHVGASYTNCAPSPKARLLRSMAEQCAAQRRLLG